MKKTVCFKVNKAYLGNKFFDVSYMNNIDFCYKVKRHLESNGYVVGTQDIVNENEANIIVTIDYRKDFKKNKGINVLIALESIAVLPQTFNNKYLQNFDLIFTWNTDIIDNLKIFPLNFTFNLDPLEYINFKNKTRLLCNVSSNKLSNHKDELYSERVKAIEFFNSTYPDKFDLFGYGWDKAYKYPFFYEFFRFLNQNKVFRGVSKVLTNIRLFDNLIYTNYSVYKGPVASKVQVLKNYKFSICFENIKNVDGFITEKIFDCFICGVIPIYLGPNNIDKIIPKNTFIDMRYFSSFSQLFDYLSEMKEGEYNVYINNIKLYLESEKIKYFDSKWASKYFVKKILSTND